MSKILTAYFSATGTTKKLAQAIAKEAGADLFEIKPAVPYTSADLDWTNKASRSTKEMNDPSSRPEIAEKVSDMSQYDTVLIGFPVWWYVAPTIIDTFLESYDFSGKKIAVFATSGGSGLGNTENILKKLSGTAEWKKGKRFSSVSTAEIQAWLKEIGIE